MVFGFSGCATAPYQGPSIPAAPKVAGGIYYEVQRGDTLWGISRLYGVDVSNIVRANNLPVETKINAGQRLLIPGARAEIALPPERRQIFEKDSFVWPAQGDVIAYFGQAVYGTRNKGIDIKAREGSSVIASKSGRVVFSSDEMKGLGRVIIVEHPDGYSTVYARNSQNLAKPGDPVTTGQVIAKAGSSGRGRGSYLHFEIRRLNKPQNPLYYLP